MTPNQVDGVEIISIMVDAFRGWLTLVMLRGYDAELMYINLPSVISHLGIYWELAEVAFDQRVQKVVGECRLE